MRHDTSVAQTDIAHPVDARLLNDSVRVLTPLLKRLREAAPISISVVYRNHTRACKKRAYQIVMGKGKNIEKRRKTLYKGLLDYQQKVRGYARRAIDGEAAAPCDVEIMGTVAQLKDVLPLAEQVYDQAHRRVIMG